MYWRSVKRETFISKVSELLILGNQLFLCEELLCSSAFIYVYDILGANAVKFLDDSALFERGRFCSDLQMGFSFIFIYRVFRKDGPNLL